MERVKVAVIGAGGKMGMRTSRNLLAQKEVYEVFLVETAPKGISAIEDQGHTVTALEDALKEAQVVVFAVPDTLIRKLSADYVPMLKPNTGFIILDPAAAYVRELTLRADCTFVVAHPCHPSYFKDQDTFEARSDRFGGDGGKQDVVASKVSGDEEIYKICEQVAKTMYAADIVYRLTTEQIAFLEPTLVELLGATCLYAMAETVDEAEKRGIPRDAAVSFLVGHIYNLSANFLGYIPGNPPVSDACKVAIQLGNKLVLRDDWKKIWDDETLEKVILTMLHPDSSQI